MRVRRPLLAAGAAFVRIVGTMKVAVIAFVLAACHAAPADPVDDALARGIGALAAETEFSGTILVGRGEDLLFLRGFGVAESARWRWASVTKQMTAILVMQEVEKGTAARATMWDGKPELGFMALGQWVYEVPLRGCEQPVKLVERRGAIGGIGVRNFIAPELGLVVIALTNRAELDFGEPWSGSGFGYELMSLAACPRVR